MPGEKLRLASLSVLGGSLHGRRRNVEEVVGEVLVGSDPDCHLVVDLPSISPIHARLWTDLDQVEVNDTRAPRGVYVNTKRVEGMAVLRPGDMLWLGPPQDPGSVCIQCRFEPWVEVLPGAGSSAEPAGVVADEEPAGVVGAEPVEVYDAFVLEDGAPEAVHAEVVSGAVEEVVTAAAAAPAVVDASVSDVERRSDGGHEPAAGADDPVPPAGDAATDAWAEAPSAEETDAFFVGEAEPPPARAAPDAGEGAFTLDEASAHPSEEPLAAAAAPASVPVESAAEPEPDAAADEWAIAEPEPAIVESLPVPQVSDEFFVSEEPAGAADFEPEVEPPVVTETAAPSGPASGAGAAPGPEPSFADFSEFEAEPHLASADEPAVVAAPVDLVPAWEAPPAPEPSPAVLETPGAAPVVAPPPPASPTPRAAAPVVSAPLADRRAEPVAAAPAPSARVEPARPGPQRRSRSARRREPFPRAARLPPVARPRGRRRVAPRGAPSWLRPLAMGLGALALVGALAAGAWHFLAPTVRVTSIEPARVRVGQRAIVNGRGFAPDAAGNVVTFDDRQAKVVSAQPERLEVEVPDVPVESGGERRVDVVVRSATRASTPVPVSVIQGPRLHGLSPEAALPGEEVLLAGAGWGLGATVRFGNAPAQVVAVDATRIRAIVPAEAGTAGTRAPVVVTVAGVESNAAPFFVGRLPVVSEIAPASAGPGDMVQVSGLGFNPNAAQNDVRIGGLPALVVSATGDTVKVVVPRLPAGGPARPVEVRVPGSTTVGQATLQAPAMPDVLELRFVAEPFTVVAGRPHAVVATGLGPAFVLAASGGRSAADRAVDAAQKLNTALPALRTTLGLNFEARGYDTSPSLGLAGQPESLLTVTEDDVAAYNEDWTGLGAAESRSPARASPAGGRLSRATSCSSRSAASGRASPPSWRPRAAPSASCSTRCGRAGSRGSRSRPSTRRGPRCATPCASSRSGYRPRSRLPPRRPCRGSRLRRRPRRRPWRGCRLRARCAAARPRKGSCATSPSTCAAPARSPTRAASRSPCRSRRSSAAATACVFSVPIRGAMRYYSGKWDGEKVAGSVSTDSAGRNVVGTFELRPR